MNRKIFARLVCAGAASAALLAATALLATPAPAHACGGLFCSSSNPVNQAAERIIFSDNADGSVTAIIQIMYEGPAHEFAWVLPVEGDPKVGVSSQLVLDAVQSVTNPQYRLTTTFAAGCTPPPATLSPNAAFGSSAGSAATADAGVTIVSSGAVGPYVYSTIAVDPTLAHPEDAAIKWFADNDYDIGSLGPSVLAPYLKDGLNLLAFKLSKDASTGSIRPVMITYQSGKPSIPIRPTAVAANDDMGVMVFLLSKARGIPENYKALELNEALIDWFNANNNYNDVVTAAADEAQGQGFVTEFAGRHDQLSLTIYPAWQTAMWNDFQKTKFARPADMVERAYNTWGSWDGFNDALQKVVTLPEGVSLSDFENCLHCYESDPAFALDETMFLKELFELVIKPVADSQALFDSRPYLTRLYTTMSAADMTIDPVFAFNPDLDDFSNLHVATQELGCSTGGNAFGGDAPWTITLPQGDVIRGAGNGRVWPITAKSQPAALRIMQIGTSGQPKVLQDHSKAISEIIESTNPPPPKGGSNTTIGAGGSAAPPGAAPGLGVGGNGADLGNDTRNASSSGSAKDDGGCNVAHGGGGHALSLLLLAALALLRRRPS